MPEMSSWLSYYFNDTAPEINFEKQNKSFHFPSIQSKWSKFTWSNPCLCLESILVWSSFDESWRNSNLPAWDSTEICSIFKFDEKEPYFTWIEAHCSKNEKSGCFWLLPKYITIYITVSNCKEHCLKKFILIFSQTKLWGVFLRILTHCEKECFRNSESKAWVWHVTDNHAF